MIRELTLEDLDFGTLIDVDEFVGKAIEEELADSDGYGRFVYGNDVDSFIEISPSDYDSIPDDVTHILWFDT